MALPRNAAEHRAWVDDSIDAFMAAVRDPGAAFEWVAHVEQEGVDFSSFEAMPQDFKPLDAKMRMPSRSVSVARMRNPREILSPTSTRRGARCARLPSLGRSRACR